jgi:nucleoside-diphosphate-sugar epimerase
MHVLVTGGAGFIGSHLVDALVQRGGPVRVLDNLSSGSLDNLRGMIDRIDFLRGDLRDAETCRRACHGIQLVFHQGALGSVPRSMEDPATTLAVNAGGTANLFAAARDAGVRRIVWASSSSVYGDSDRLPKREGEEGRPLSPYALSKVMGEEMMDVFGRCFGMEIVGLRYFNVYGPRQTPEGPYAAVVPRFFHALLADEPPTIHDDGEQSRDFTYVADAVEANLRAAEAPVEACGRAYNVAPGSRTTINELAAEIRRLVGGPEPVHGPPRPGDVRHSMADASKAREMLGFEAQTGLAEGLAAARGWYAVGAAG